MPVVNRIAAFAEEMTGWRRHLHTRPELGFACHETAAFVADRLREFGVDEIHDGIAETGLVALIRGQKSGPVVGLRADMDALPMDEVSGVDHASTIPGMMHACGHDGHTAMLLGAARYLTETRAFAGTVALIFQPAEEGEGGGRAMVEAGIMDRFGIEAVYGLHNAPGEPEGHVLTNPGALLAGEDSFSIAVQGQGGHAAMPERTRDPVAAAVAIVQALNTIVARNLSALDRLVLSVTQLHAGTADNIVPDRAEIGGTIRYFDAAARDAAKARLHEIARLQAESLGCSAEVTYHHGYPPTINDPDRAAFAAGVAAEVVGAERVTADAPPIMAAEDFAYMLQARPGAYLFVGQGDTPTCHHPAYDFVDGIAPVGASLLARIAERALPLD